MKKTMLMVLVSLAIVLPLWSATIYVDINAGGNNDGTSWTHAYTSLQSALDVATSPDEIWIAKGTYVPSSDYGLVGGGRSTYNHFRLINGVTVYGGFAGTESAVSERTNYAPGQDNETILSGDLGGDHCYHVFYHNSIGLDNTAVLDGVTISDGMAYYETVVEHTYGGGMHNNTCTPTLVNVTFKNNEAKYGGAMFNTRSGLSMTNCSFTGNHATVSGGAMYNTSGAPILVNGLISDNTCDGDGGSICLLSSAMQMTNVTITGNSADNGGGIYSNNSDPELYNCIIWGNSSTTNGNEIYIDTGAPIFNFSCYGNDAGDVYNNGGTLTATNNCITTNPQFVGPSNNATHPYSISGISPCTDTGYDSYCSESYDIRGNGFDRKLDKTTGAAGTIDMGAYEYKVGDDALPVELVSFTASNKGNSINLEWTTASENDNLGFVIYRKSGSTDWQQLASYQTHSELTGQGSTSSPSQYCFMDNNTIAGVDYTYRLYEVCTSGAKTEIGTTTVTATIPSTTQLFAAYPNPFNPSTTLNYNLAKDGHVTLTVYDVLGRQIKTLLNQQQVAGDHSIQWDGSTDSGTTATSGTYLVRMQTTDFSQIHKVLYIK